LLEIQHTAAAWTGTARVQCVLNRQSVRSEAAVIFRVE